MHQRVDRNPWKHIEMRGDTTANFKILQVGEYASGCLDAREDLPCRIFADSTNNCTHCKKDTVLDMRKMVMGHVEGRKYTLNYKHAKLQLLPVQEKKNIWC